MFFFVSVCEACGLIYNTQTIEFTLYIALSGFFALVLPTMLIISLHCRMFLRPFRGYRSSGRGYKSVTQADVFIAKLWTLICCVGLLCYIPHSIINLLGGLGFVMSYRTHFCALLFRAACWAAPAPLYACAMSHGQDAGMLGCCGVRSSSLSRADSLPTQRASPWYARDRRRGVPGELELTAMSISNTITESSTGTSV